MSIEDGALAFSFASSSARRRSSFSILSISNASLELALVVVAGLSMLAVLSVETCAVPGPVRQRTKESVGSMVTTLRPFVVLRMTEDYEEFRKDGVKSA